jgi:glutathione-specific gamma-glutamylcyclotransferase
MWIFGYGSLMWDGWQTKHACNRSMLANLHGYSRAFNKASVRNWGTKNKPGPTLNLQRAEHQSCRGIAFEFVDHQRRALTDLPTEREGCTPLDLTIRLDNGAEVVASVNVYAGRNIIKSRTIDDIASMIVKARGEKGSCVSYVKSIAEELHEMGIEDPIVSATWQAVQRAQQDSL